MKNLAKLAVFCITISFMTSCKDSKKVDPKVETDIEQVESIEKEVDSISNSIEKETKALEDALSELDNI